mgnify:CR=1 FL=1
MNQKTRIYGITLFFLITLLTIILYKIHKHRLYKKIIELTASFEEKIVNIRYEPNQNLEGEKSSKAVVSEIKGDK